MLRVMDLLLKILYSPIILLKVVMVMLEKKKLDMIQPKCLEQLQEMKFLGYSDHILVTFLMKKP